MLALMPLHAITEVHGEAGLRERFAAEIEQLPADDRLRASQALELAGQLHAADRRQREPYVNHLLRVAIRIISYYHVSDPDVICAAVHGALLLTQARFTVTCHTPKARLHCVARM